MKCVYRDPVFEQPPEQRKSASMVSHRFKIFGAFNLEIEKAEE